MSDGWLKTGGHTRCPQCKDPDVEVRSVLVARPLGTWSLPGSQPKTVASWGWVFRCNACGTTGPAQEKTDDEKGKWTDE